MQRYLGIIEKADGTYSAYSPDLPGCVATGTTRDEAGERMRDAIRPGDAILVKGSNSVGLAALVETLAGRKD